MKHSAIPRSVAACRRVHRAGRLVLGIGLLAAIPGAFALSSPADDVLRERIALERRLADDALAQRRWECSRKFAVTACLNDARAEHREVFERLDKEEEALDSKLRHQRAAHRLAIIREKTEALARLPSSSVAAPAPLAPPPPPAASQGHTADPGDSTERAARHEADREAAERAAAQRAAASQRRRDEAARRQAQREAQQAQQKKPAAGLPARPPIPPAATPASTPN